MKNVSLLIILFLVSFTMNSQNSNSNPNVSVTGEGSVKVLPDQVIIRVRVENEGTTAASVKAENDQTIDAVLKFCNKIKIDSKDVQTEYINLNKNYNYQTKEYKYKANQSLSIKLRELADYERLMQGLVESGINRIDGVNFRSSDMDIHLSNARKKAVENAKKKAVEYAGVLDQKIGKAISISEQTTFSRRPMDFSNQVQSRSMAEFDSSAETISTGEMLVTAKVQVVFQLN